jgi:hypothetical protein
MSRRCARPSSLRGAGPGAAACESVGVGWMITRTQNAINRNGPQLHREATRALWPTQLPARPGLVGRCRNLYPPSVWRWAQLACSPATLLDHSGKIGEGRRGDAGDIKVAWRGGSIWRCTEVCRDQCGSREEKGGGRGTGWDFWKFRRRSLSLSADEAMGGEERKSDKAIGDVVCQSLPGRSAGLRSFGNGLGGGLRRSETSEARALAFGVFKAPLQQNQATMRRPGLGAPISAITGTAMQRSDKVILNEYYRFNRCESSGISSRRYHV